MPEICMGGGITLEMIPEMARDMWESYELTEKSDWVKESLKKGFSTGFDALLSASYVAYANQTEKKGLDSE